MLQLDEVIEGCKKYDKTCQKLLYNLFAAQARSLCYRYLNNSHDLDDVVHDGFIKIFIKINQYAGKGSFEGWLKRVFINTSLEHNKRNRKNRNFFSIEILRKKNDDGEGYVEDSIEEYIEPGKNDESSAGDLKVDDFSENEIMEVVGEIPEKLRLVFNMYCIEDFSHEEIAEILNIDIVTSRTRLLRARCYIKKSLQELCLEKKRIKA